MLETSTPDEPPTPNEQTNPAETHKNPSHHFDVNRELREFFKEFYWFTIEMYKDVALDSSLRDDYMPELPEALRKPEMLFNLKVFSPCFFIYGELPGFLLRKARLGDINAIDKLLRVDKGKRSSPLLAFIH